MIDIYEINNNLEKYLLSINENEFFILKNVFEKFRKKTGYNIDEYNDLILTEGAIENLLYILNEKIKIKDENKLLFSKYYKFFSAVKNNGGKLAFYGD